MGTEALDPEKVEQTNVGDPEDQQLNEDDGNQESDGQEVEVVLPTDDGSPPKPQHFGIRKRINKLNARNEAAEGRASDAESKLEVVEQQNKLLKLALDQKGTTPASDLPPDPNDFDDGAKDPRYVKDLQDYNQKVFSALYDKRAVKQDAAPTPTNASLERKQTAHYEAAEKLGVKDYDKAEDGAIEILGKDTVRLFISNTDSVNSARALYFLGKNPDKASEIAELIRTDPIAGVLELGALAATLKVRPRQKTNVAPDPDNELSGAVNKDNKRRGPPGATFT